MGKSEKIRHSGIYAGPWMIVGAVAILLIIVAVLAVNNIHRERRYMARILSEKGAALIKSFEAGARTGMMAMMWGENQVQSLLEETSRQPGILYLVITDEKGEILAHSDRGRIGQRFPDMSIKDGLEPGDQARWRLVDLASGRRSFEVYGYFNPFEDTGSRIAGRGMMSQMMMPNGWCLPSNVTGKEQIILVGLDVEPFESAIREDVRNTMVISSVLLLLGLGGFFSMFLAQRYRTTRRMLQDTSAFANEAVTNLPVGLIASDREGKIAVFNSAAEKITGLRFEDVRGKSYGEVLPSQLCGLNAFLDEKEPVLEKEMECVFSGENPLPLSVSAAQIRNEEGRFVGNVLILKDLGEVRMLQEEVRRKEKLAALGSLAAGIAHEIRNPLSSIKGMASFFRNKFVEGSEDREAASVMVQEVDRLNRVIGELLEFARPSDLKLKPTDVNEVLEHSVRFVEQDARTKNVNIRLMKGDGLPPAMMDPDRFSQCLLNLYLNAIQAMDEGGLLTVRSSNGGSDNVQVMIEDTGRGMSQDVQEKIFDPYFTTKPSGTGLGLAIVHKIIEAHRGSVRVWSTPNKGTAFTIRIPVSPSGLKR
ncbi:MAG: histidine kinase [Deltaproteobacteria bacterium HGW-Deltaproteobacteria-15]|jgi:two-component system sensor histidine kinase HydH|nr:MAG: histidine kinase [Deltaproteobacteria bacterium HGW-Deltaproteobacteria-15]